MRLAWMAATVLLLAACAAQASAMPAAERSVEPNPSVGAAPSSMTPAPSDASIGDAAAALELATRFETARAAAKWSVAWPLLSERSQATIGSLASFTAEEAAYNAQGGTMFSVQPPTQDADLVANFLGGSQAAIAQVADVSRGYLIFALHPDVKAASAGTTGLYVAPLRNGDWRIWIVH